MMMVKRVVFSEKIMHPKKVFHLFAILQATLVISSQVAPSLENSTASSVIVPGLASGFSGIPRREDTESYSSNTSCSAKGPGASCDVKSSITYNRPGSAPGPTPAATVPAVPIPTPGQPPEERQGTPPVESAGPGAKGEGNNSKPGNGSDERPFPTGAIVGVILGITGIIIVSVIICRFLKRRCSLGSRIKDCDLDVENFLLQHGSLAPKRYKYSEIEKITKSFSDKLGQGGCGSVYKGMLPNGDLVAIKVLTETKSNGKEFINEVVSISKTSHVNIVKLLGFCYDGDKRILVYEFMPNKSLDKFIDNSANCQPDWEKLYKIAIGVAKGLEYLHTGCNTRIVHFDIKPQNILLDNDFTPKISDFGLAKLCKKKPTILSTLGARGTIGYIAPELFYGKFKGLISHKSDVYSYGMMMLEMAGARKIEEDEAIQSSEDYFPDRIYNQVILDVTKKLENVMVDKKDDDDDDDDDDDATKMLLVGFWCIQTNPSNRPLMSKVVEMLEGSLQSVPIPPKPILFYPNTLSSGQEIPSSSSYVEIE